MGPLLSFLALFALPLIGAIMLPTTEFAFWALLATVSTVALSLDFGGAALLASRYHFAPRFAVFAQSCLLSVVGALIVGLVAVLIWIPLEQGSFSGTTSFAEGAAAIGVMTLAAAARSVLIVVAQAGLLETWSAIRNVALAGHASVAVLATLVLLIVAPSYWALPMGWLISGAIFVPLCLVWLLLRSRRSPHVIKGTNDLNWARFAGLRTLNTIVASIVLQGDRWVVAIIGGPVWLALYEVAWRFAALPRTLIQALALHISADVAPMTRGQEDELMDVVRRSTTVLAIVGAASSVVVGVFYVVFTELSGEAGDLRLFSVMVVAFTALALTAPLSIAGTSAGRPGIDLPYALVALVGSSIFALVGAWMDNTWLFVLGYLATLIASVPVFFAYAPRMARTALDSRYATPVPPIIRSID